MIVEGESLVNDATALVALRVAVVAAVSGTFSLSGAGLRFVGVVGGGLAVGLAVGYIVRQVRRRIDDPPVEVTISLLTGYFAFIPADLLHVSGVVAVVTAGVYLGWHTPELTTPDSRLLGDSMWEITTFVLNALLFVMLGLQLPEHPRRAPGRAVRDADLVGGDREPHRDRGADRLGLPGHLHSALAVAAHPRARPVAAVAVPGGDLVDGPARSRLARGRALRAGRHEQRRAVPRPRARDLPRVLGDHRDPRLPGSLAAGGDPPARARGRRARREGRGEGADQGGEGGARSGSRSSPARTG